MYPFLWPLVVLLSVLAAMFVAMQFLGYLEQKTVGVSQLAELRAMLSAYPPAQELVDQLDELRQNFAELQDKAQDFVSSEQLDRLLTREGAEKIVANVNAIAKDTAEMKQQFDHILSNSTVREVFGLEEE